MHSLNTRPSPIAADLHLHTRHSHGQAEVADMFTAARAKGLSIIGFSEHSPRPLGYDYPDDYRESLTATYPSYVAEVLALKEEEAAKGGATVLLGLEMDWIEAEHDFMAATIAQYDYDYIIAGIHFLGTWGFDCTAADWAPLNEAERAALYLRYYQTMAAMAQTGMFNIVAHPDLIKIFSCQSFTRWLDSPQGRNAVADALNALKSANMVLEISSAGLRKPCAEIYPGPVIMRMAADIGLPVSFASDAHCTNTPAYAFDQLAAYAASFGYSESVWFQGRQARSIAFR